MSAREEILQRIRTATAASADDAPVVVPREYHARGAGEPGSAALLDLLTDRLEDYKATVHRCAAADVATTVTSAMTERGAARVVVPPGLGRDAGDASSGWFAGWDGTVVTDSATSPLSVTDLDGMDGVVTACAVAIADTGTIVLDAGPDQGRRAITLVPDYHLVVVRADQVVRSVPEGVARMDPARPLTMISGPSATSDIELQRVEGVHGPRTLVVVLVG